MFHGRIAFTAETTRNHHPRHVEFMLRLDTVELIFHGKSLGIVDRDALRLWLARPQDPLDFDDARLTYTTGGLGIFLEIGDSVIPMPIRVHQDLHDKA